MLAGLTIVHTEVTYLKIKFYLEFRVLRCKNKIVVKHLCLPKSYKDINKFKMSKYQ